MSAQTTELSIDDQLPVWQLAVASFVPPARRDKAQRWILQLPLIAILLLQAVLTQRLANTAFRDEALYIWTGHREIAHFFHGAVLYDKPDSYFSGAPVVYPVIAAVLDRAGGLELVRLLSLLFMLSATASIYYASCRLFTRRVATLAAFAFAVAGPTQHLGHFATFDAMALSLIAGSMALGVSAVQKHHWRWAPLVAAMLALAVVSKYAAALFVPFVLSTMALTASRRLFGVKLAAATGLLTAAILVALGLTIGKADVQGLKSTTTNRTAIEFTSVRVLAEQTWHFVGPWWVVAMLGAVIAAVTQRRRLLPLLLAAGMVAPFVYQAHIHESVSLDKHLDFGLVFGAPLIGLTATVTRAMWQRLVVLAMSTWLLLTGLSVSNFLFHQWSNTTPLARVMSYAFKSDPYIKTLGDISEPLRYHFEDSTEYYQWSTTDSVTYQPKSGPPLTGLAAAKAGLAAHYWQYVYLDGVVGLSRDITPLMAKDGYKLTDTVVLHNDGGDDTYQIWQNFDAAAAP